MRRHALTNHKVHIEPDYKFKRFLANGKRKIKIEGGGIVVGNKQKKTIVDGGIVANNQKKQIVEGGIVKKNDIRINKYISIKMSKKTLMRAFVEMVTMNALPLGIIKSGGFRKIIDPICAALGGVTINAASLKHAITETLWQMKSSIVKELKGQMFSLHIYTVLRFVLNLFCTISNLYLFYLLFLDSDVLC